MNKNYVRLLLCQTTVDMRRKFTKRLQQINLSFPQWNALKAIRGSEEPLSAKDLVYILNSDKATVSGIINRLAESNYIEVKVNPNDRRGTLLYLKDDSMNLCSEVIAIENEFNSEIFVKFSDKDLEDFTELLKKMEI